MHYFASVSLTACSDVTFQLFMLITRPKTPILHLFYRIDSIYIVETCIRVEYPSHYIQFSKNKDILSDYYNLGVYDILNQYDLEVNYSNDTAPYSFNRSYNYHICIDTCKMKVYHEGYNFFSYSKEFKDSSVYMTPDPYFPRNIFVPSDSMTVFSFPSEHNGHVYTDQAGAKFSFIGYVRDTLNIKTFLKLSLIISRA